MSNLREAAQHATDAYSVDVGFRASRITREAMEQLRAALTQPDDKAQSGTCDGWRLVPVEPTETMLKAGVTGSDSYGTTMGDARGCYISMIDNAPQLLAEQDAELSDEQILELAEPFGCFNYGDAQGDKRLNFARAIIAAYRAARGGAA